MSPVKALLLELKRGQGRALTDADVEVLREAATPEEMIEAAIVSHPCRNAEAVMRRYVERREGRAP